MAKRTLSREHLPPGATAFAHKGELYVPQDDGSVTDINGHAVELPEDFPSDEELGANMKRAAGGFGGPQAAPMDLRVPGSSGSGVSQEGSAGGAGDTDYDGMTKDDLAEMAAGRDLDVKATGSSDEPLKADYIKALKKADRDAKK